MVFKGLGVRRAAARASPTLPSPCKPAKLGRRFAYSGSGNVVGRRPLAEIPIDGFVVCYSTPGPPAMGAALYKGLLILHIRIPLGIYYYHLVHLRLLFSLYDFKVL